MHHLTKQLVLFFIAFGLTTSTYAQVNYTANDVVPTDLPLFGYGTNMGWFPPWSDKQLANIAIGNPALSTEGLGMTALRPALPEHFLEQYGYRARISEFQHYARIGARNNTVFIGYPSEAHRDTVAYCKEHPNQSFANLYQPIWDNGENGTPVNDDNYFALYVFRTASIYGKYVRYWEVWNEPDFDWTNHAWLAPGQPGNWWDNNPPPCQNAIKAPIFHYIRMLRISYEVIKTLYPDAYVAVGGLGYPSFLDSVCRNTDNPDNGKITAEFPLKGGAYFDCLSFHSYPHIDGSLRYWSNDINGFVYERHSDKAVDGVLEAYNKFTSVLQKYGYGKQFPEKATIITECNIPRVAFEPHIGSDLAQRNFLVKTAVMIQQVGVQQLCVYNLGEGKKEPEATSEFDLMGLFKNLNNVKPYRQKVNPSGVAYKTVAALLRTSRYDPERTRQLALPPGIRGGAFTPNGKAYLYVLWAATTKDQDETASGTYRFPDSFKVNFLQVMDWDNADTGISQRIDGQEIKLTSSPIFIRVK